MAVLAEQGSATVRELRERLQVSPETIRRDLSILDQQSLLKKTHGGAVMVDAKPDNDRPYADSYAVADAGGARHVPLAALYPASERPR